MKVLMKPVKMIACFEENGKIQPVRFQIKSTEGENIIVNVQRIMLHQEEKLAGNRMYIYRCQSVINGQEKLFELKYEIGTCKWFLFKM